MPKLVVNWSAAVATAVALVGALGWLYAGRARADAAYELANKDHDAVVRLEVLLPRLEKALDRLERQR